MLKKHAISYALVYTGLSLTLAITSCTPQTALNNAIKTPQNPMIENLDTPIQAVEQARFIYTPPTSFQVKDVDLSQLAFLKLSLVGEGLSKEYVHSGEAFIPVNTNGDTVLDIPDIPLQTGKIRVVTVQGYDNNKKELFAFQAKGIYKSQTGASNVLLDVDRRQLLTGKVIEKMLVSAGFDSGSLDINALQSQIDEATGFQENTQKFATDPLLFDADQIQLLLSENRLNSESIDTELTTAPVNAEVFLRTANGCPFDKDITLQVNAPGIEDIIIAKGSKSPAQPTFTLPVGTWTVTAKKEGQLLASERIQVNTQGIVTGSIGSSIAMAWTADSTAPVVSHYVAKLVAGSGVGDGYQAKDAYLKNPSGFVLESDGSLIFADLSNHRVRKVTPDGKIVTIVGNGGRGYTGDGAQATSAQMRSPKDIVKDEQGNLYVSDVFYDVIRKITPQGIISTFAGNGTAGFSGDGGPATSAQLNEPGGLFWKDGALYIADRLNARVRKVSANGLITTIAGNGELIKQESGLATETSIGGSTQAVYIDDSNTMYIADGSFSRVLKISPTGQLSVYIGQGNSEVSGDLYLPKDIYIDNNGLFHVVTGQQVMTVENNALKVYAGSQASRLGTALIGRLGDNGPAVDAFLKSPSSVIKDNLGNVFIADTGHGRIRRIDTNGTMTTFAGGGVGDNGPATNAFLDYSRQLNFDNEGNLLIADGRFRVRKVNKETGLISTIAGNGFSYLSGDGGPAKDALIQGTSDLLGRPDGSILLASSGSRRVRKIDVNGQIETLFNFTYPVNMTPGRDGEIYISDYEREQIYRYKPDTGAVEKIAGNENLYENRNEDNSAAFFATLYRIWDIAYEPYSHGLIVAYRGDRRVRKIDLTTGIINTIAGNGEQVPNNWTGTEGDGGPAIQAPMLSGSSLGSDDCGNIYMATKNVLRKVDRQSGIISTVAGLPTNTFLEDGSPWPQNWTMTATEYHKNGSFTSVIADLVELTPQNSHVYRHYVYTFVPQYE